MRIMFQDPPLTALLRHNVQAGKVHASTISNHPNGSKSKDEPILKTIYGRYMKSHGVH